jgi:hypothetical protein
VQVEVGQRAGKMLPREQEVTIENRQDEAARTDNITAYFDWILV